MRLIQRLAAGMCADRIKVLEDSRQAAGENAHSVAWKECPASVRRFLQRGAVLQAQLHVVKAAVERAGFRFNEYELIQQVSHEERVSYKDARERARKAKAAIDKRIDAVNALRQRALREILGMDEKAGKKYLDRLEKELQKV